ncbi:MAG: IS630 family transposase [Acidobacteria bacterium]|nr:IS630 family transposase [Acidobacteriota bacterium]
MWCIGRITEEYRHRMYDILALYAKPYDAQEPVVCVDEKSKQLLAQTRCPLPARPGAAAKEDYEYKRAGTCNLFMAVEPKGRQRQVEVTARRTKPDFVGFVRALLETVYARADRVHLVLDNLNTHFRACFEEVLGMAAAARLLERLQFHYTPKHASWLNMAELEIGIMGKQCTDQRLAHRELLAQELAAWQLRRNTEKRGIDWKFTRQDADRKLFRHYVS